mmetsp:Transcript_30429/g.51277  ORF Transcript_30429/g.51277 Transcript_30429/m.51277 type:complete len:307 (-) Transcript_30429:337-1257(-)
MQNDCVLCVHAVLRLLEDDGVGRFTDFVGAFTAALRRQTVQELALLPCPRHHGSVHLEALVTEHALARCRLILLLHGRPDICVDEVSANHCGFGIVTDGDLRDARRLSHRQSLHVREKTFRAAAHELHWHDCGIAHPRVDNVVAIAHVHHFRAFQLSARLPNSQGIGQNLAGVVVIGEAVDDGHAAVLCEVQDVLVTKDARHNDVIEAAENARDILGGLALAQLDGVRPEVKGVASEKVEARLERNPSAHRWLREDHSHRLPLERLERPIPRLEQRLHLLSPLQQSEQLVLCEVVQVQEVLRRPRG